MIGRVAFNILVSRCAEKSWICVVEGAQDGLRRRTTEGLNVADRGTFLGQPLRNMADPETVIHIRGNFCIKES